MRLAAATSAILGAAGLMTVHWTTSFPRWQRPYASSRPRASEKDVVRRKMGLAQGLQSLSA
jgi:hypothetical protein